MLSATALWITQLIYIGISASECNYCTSSSYNTNSYNNYYYDCPYTLWHRSIYGLGTAAAFTAALGTLLSIPAVLRSEAVILIKQQRALAQLSGMMVVQVARPLEMEPMGVAASV
jgi:hypothetical protein